MTDEQKRIVNALRICGRDEGYVCGCDGKRCGVSELKDAPDCIDKLMQMAADEIERTAQKFEQVKRERDAVIQDIIAISNSTLEQPGSSSLYMCGFCAYGSRENDGSFGCTDENLTCKFQWRGPCKENGGEKE